MSTAINWQVSKNEPLLKHPLYLKYSGTAIASIEPMAVKGDLGKALASVESSSLISYLCWLLRVTSLMTG